MPGAIPESSIVRAWQRGLTGRQDLVTEDGGPLRIIYPGRPNDDRGADLRDAVVVTTRGKVRGDVEVHVRSSSWWGHGHHLDPSYNRVVLHVVYRHDTVFPARLQNGTLVPTLELQRFLTPANIRRSRTSAPKKLPCTGRRRGRDADFIERALDTAGDERFEDKSRFFLDEISREGAGQALYGGIMEALGYSHNQGPMRELARRVPLERLETLTKRGISDEECLAVCQSCLLGAAGLLPSQRRGQFPSGNTPLSWIDRLENIREKSGEQAQMTGDDWHFFKVRPGNYPDRRIAAISCLLVRYRDRGLLEGLMGVFEAATENDPRSLEQAIYIGSGDGNTARLGEERAAEIVVNVLLPFIYAVSLTGMGEQARRCYCSYPAGAGNTIERHMRQQLGLETGVLNTARRQQGLLHVFKKYCSQGGCKECPLGEGKVKI